MGDEFFEVSQEILLRDDMYIRYLRVYFAHLDWYIEAMNEPPC